MKINELSNDKLADYKKKAGADASAADKRGDYERGNKRFRGIVKATKKQFSNDVKNHYDDKEQSVAEGSEEVDTHGRTKAEWVKAVHAKYPMARVIYSKDNTQVMAVLPNRKEIRWIKDEGIIEQGMTEGEIEENLDANQKRAGQLGPTEKVKNNNIGKLVGVSESIQESEITEEMIAKRLRDELALFKKGQRKDSELSKKPRDREIQAKVTEISDQTIKNYAKGVEADSRKHKMDPTKRSAEKRNRSVSGFAKAMNRLDKKAK